LKSLFKTVLFASCAVGAFSAPARAQDDEAQNAPVAAAAVSDEIIVTARRTDERLQDVPVAVAAFDNRALERSTVQELSEVKSIASGLNFNSEGGKSTTNVSLRGIGQLPVGLTTPGVVTYFNNIAIPSLGSSIPTYDIANIQVLKGPQGTLFGKSTLGGAILVNTVQPNLYDVEGYVRGTYGRFEYRAIEGAINVPIVPGKIALRLAGQIRRQDERIRSLDADFFATPEVQALGVSDPNAGDYPGFDDVNNDSVRASLTIAPSDRFSNTTVAEYFRADERAAGLYLFKADLAALQNTALFPLMGDPTRAAIAVQLAALAQDYAQENPRGAFDGGINGGQAYRKSVAIVNTTSFELTDSLSLRNIFGYRKNTNEQSINTSALPILDQGGIPNPFFGGLVTQPFITYFAEQRYVRDYIDNDFQILYDGASGLNGILGAYYSVDGPAGPSGDQFTTFSSLGRIPATTTHVKNRSFAIYSQVTIPLTDRLNLNLGGRYSWDKAEFCYNPGNAATFESVSFDECKQNVADRVGTATEFSDGFGQASVKDSYPTWTVGFDYKATPDLLLYVTSRRGVRPKNLNFPLFESDPVTCPSGNYSISCVDLTSYQTIKQERVTDIEIGEKLTFNLSGARGRINLAGFYSKYENATQFLSNSGNFMFPRGTLDAPPSSFIINAADLSIYGLEIDASVSPDDNLTIGFNGAITKTKIDKLLPVNTGGELGPNVGSFGREQINKLTPSFSGTFSASWISPVHPADADLIFSGDLYMTDDFGGQQGFQLEGYSLVNGRVDLKGIANSGLDLGFYVKNLFDVEYQAGVSVILPAAPYNSLYLGPPRTWGVEAKYTF
jgi:iron complex outermembrane recepter protein